MIPRRRQAELETLLAEQIAYYRARAPEYTSTAIPDVSQRDGAADEPIEGESPSVICRILNDGTRFRAVKERHTPEGLERRLASLGWRFEVARISGAFFVGTGSQS